MRSVLVVWPACAVVLLTSALLAGCGRGGEDAADQGGDLSSATAPALSARAELGRRIFSDTTLSASRRQSCASCHVASAGHAADNALAAQLGGPLLDRQGSRTSMSIRYLATNTPFAIDADGKASGGFFWDGRAATLAQQAAAPFLNPVEMAMPSKAAVVARLAQAPYADDFRRVFGADILLRADAAFDAMTLALQQFQLEALEFTPFSSKYDAVLRGQAVLTAQEARGLRLFNDSAKGNCAACHPSARGDDGSPPLFTDFSYDNLGIPRNPALAANADAAHFDLGLCARPAGDLRDQAELCGAFKVPSLRNVALRRALFHNGRFANLKDALTFYVQRDIHPEKFYPLRADGGIDRFDDLPAAYRGNVNATEAPYDRKPGDAPALSDAEIDDVIAFLETLNDGWQRRVPR